MSAPRRPRESDPDDLSAPLRADVRRLSSMLGEVIAESGGEAPLADVERLRKATIELRSSRGQAAENRLARVVDLVAGFSQKRAADVARAFTVYFQLVNLAEERHRVRILRDRSRSQEVVAESLAATLAELRAELGEAGAGHLVESLELRPVLTAHPTEARRRAVVEGLRRIGQELDQLDDPRLSRAQRADGERRLGEEVTILWRTAQVRSQRPAPLDEVRSAMAIFDESLFRLVPLLYRELERALGAPAAEVPVFLRWGSWVGGDRDGNPHVTHEVTEAAAGIQATHVLLGLEAATRRIGRSLTLSADSTSPSSALLEALEQARLEVPGAQELAAQSPGEPHREFLLLAAERLRATRLQAPGAYRSAGAFIAGLRTAQASLRDGGAERVAWGELQHLVWQAETFGFHLASLEVRQHSSVHRAVLAELVPGAEADARRLDAIAAGSQVPEARPTSDTAREVLATFQVMAGLQARFGLEACRRHVVSFTRSAADVVAVAALARLAVPDGHLVVDPVPLFESRADLEAAPGVLDDLLDLPGWKRWLESRGRRLEVMLGYSDATKDAGYLAANLGLYGAQAALAGWASRHGVELTLFHGRGGAVGRGGGPAGRAIRSQAPGSVDCRFKVTEQGEVIFARYGNPAIALRHLEQVASATLGASLARHQRLLAAAEKRFARGASLMARTSEAAYRRLVDTEGFAEFFAQVTPVDAIGELAIGSRPARRAAGAPRDLEQLRAIPWVFAWTQNRCNLPGWFGLGTGLSSVAEAEGMDYLRQMAGEWPLLASIIDNAEMSLAKADPMIAGLYLERGGRPDLVDVIREEYRLTRRLLLELTGSRRLLDRHPILRLAVDLRNPYVDALSFLQLRFLRDQRPDLVRLTIGGIAAGLQNTG